MVHDSVPCPRCAEPTPSVLEACEHCERPLGPTTGRRPRVAQVLLAYGVLAAALATVLAVGIGATLAVATSTPPVEAFAPAGALLAATLAWFAVYRLRYAGAGRS